MFLAEETVCQGQEVERGLVHSEDCMYSALVWEERSEPGKTEVSWSS